MGLHLNRSKSVWACNLTIIRKNGKNKQAQPSAWCVSAGCVRLTLTLIPTMAYEKNPLTLAYMTIILEIVGKVIGLLERLYTLQD